MATIRELCNLPADRYVLMEMFRGNKKMADDDISDMTPRQLKEAIKVQEMQGRTWEYKTINLK